MESGGRGLAGWHVRWDGSDSSDFEKCNISLVLWDALVYAWNFCLRLRFIFLGAVVLYWG